MNKKSKPKYNMWQNSCFMIGLAWKVKEKKVVFISILIAITAVLMNLTQLFVTPAILDAVENRVSLSQLITIILLFTLALMLFSAASSYLVSNSLYGRIQVRCSGIINALNSKASTTSYPNVNDENFKKLCTKASETASSNNQAAEAIWKTLTDLLKNVLGFVVYMLMLFSLDTLLIAVILITTIIGYFVTNRLGEYEYRHREEVAEYENRMWYISNVSKDCNGAKDIRIFGIRPWLEELCEKALSCYTAFHRKANNVYIWGKICDCILSFARNGIAYWYLLRLVLNEGMSAPEFLLYFSAVGGFATWVSGILSSLSTLHKQSLDISTVRECLDYPEVFDFEKGKALEPNPNGSYEIRLKNISFKYPESENYILKNIDLTLQPGEKIAVVGLNGAGKTTLVKILCGFYDPTEGEVLLNGRNIKEYNRRDYYKMFSAVFQSFSLIPGSIAANVSQMTRDYDMTKVKKCIELAGLSHKVEGLPQGYQTKLNRNVYEDALMLSGGETQRLMLARALYKDAPIVVLDEPTAALDPIAEAELYGKYNDMTEGKSSVYISHRLASTRFCDRIILIENASLSEQGTHEELIALGGRYAELFGIQSKYYKDGGDGNEEEN